MAKLCDINKPSIIQRSSRVVDVLKDVKSDLAGTPLFGFVDGHGYLTDADVAAMEQLRRESDPALVGELEQKLAAIAHRSTGVGFASARMAFNSLLRALDIGKGDEVILTGFTCAVMSTAVIRTGAKPVYCDIDEPTLGMSSQSLVGLITPATKVVVAQHSFGLPCEIEAIRDVTTAAGLFLIEDCAIAVGSKRNGTPLGSQGDAVIFSTDHSKPVNTLVGGFVALDDKAVAVKVRTIRDEASELSAPHQAALLRRLRLEGESSDAHSAMKLRRTDAIASILQPFRREQAVFLEADAVPTAHAKYPYPAPLPSFLAYAGLRELERWDTTAANRQHTAELLRRDVESAMQRSVAPGAYGAPENLIVPHRFAFLDQQGPAIRAAIEPFVATSWTWFMEPIIATSVSLSSLGYIAGSCPVSERVGSQIVNLPLPQDEAQLSLLRMLLRGALEPLARRGAAMSPGANL